MEYFLVRYNSRVVIYERKMFIRLDTARANHLTLVGNVGVVSVGPSLALEVVNQVLSDGLCVVGQAQGLLSLVLLWVVR